MTLPTKQATDGLMDDTENSGRPSKRRRASPELTPESLISRSDHENTPEMLPPPAQPQIGPASPPLEPVRKEARKHNADAKREQIVLYTKLLNEEIRLQQSHTIYEQKDTDCPLRSSYISGSWWTTEEKETFFNHLATAGKGRIDKIADAIPTKSIVECRAYLLELEAGLEFYSDNSQRRRRLLTYEDIPAAAEVSEDCTHALDRLAEDLEKRLIHLENRRGFKEFKGLWDWDKALALERQDKEILDIPRLVDLSTE